EDVPVTDGLMLLTSGVERGGLQSHRWAPSSIRRRHIHAGSHVNSQGPSPAAAVYSTVEVPGGRENHSGVPAMRSNADAPSSSTNRVAESIVSTCPSATVPVHRTALFRPAWRSTRSVTGPRIVA